VRQEALLVAEAVVLGGGWGGAAGRGIEEAFCAWSAGGQEEGGQQEHGEQTRSPPDARSGLGRPCSHERRARLRTGHTLFRRRLELGVMHAKSSLSCLEKYFATKLLKWALTRPRNPPCVVGFGQRLLDHPGSTWPFPSADA